MRRRARATRASERGLAAPLVVTLTGLLLVLAVLAAGLGRLLVDQRRVAAAADLAALAGAAALQRGLDACTAARGTAQRNGAELRTCSVSSERVTVTASLTSPVLQGLFGWADQAVAIEVQSEAGPVG